jgi:hypothetical protein
MFASYYHGSLAVIIKQKNKKQKKSALPEISTIPIANS